MPGTWLQYGVDALDAGYAGSLQPRRRSVRRGPLPARGRRAQEPSRGDSSPTTTPDAYLESVLLRCEAHLELSQGGNRESHWAHRRPPAGQSVAPGFRLLPSRAPLLALAPVAGNAFGGELRRRGRIRGFGRRHGRDRRHRRLYPPPPREAIARTAANGQRPQVPCRASSSTWSRRPTPTLSPSRAGASSSSGDLYALGRYLMLRDVYGDVFTYAGLGSIASTYQPGSSRRTDLAWRARLANAVANSNESSSPSQAASAGRELPATLKVAPPSASGRMPVLSAGSPFGAHRSSAPSASFAKGKVRLYAHPGNPDALAAATRLHSHSHAASGRVPLRAGSVVARGTVLGRVRVAPGTHAGHLRFAIQPAGDSSTIDPRPIIANWIALEASLHPQGAAKGESDLLGATASGVFLQSKSELQRALLSDPNVSMPACGARSRRRGRDRPARAGRARVPLARRLAPHRRCAALRERRIRRAGAAHRQGRRRRRRHLGDQRHSDRQPPGRRDHHRPHHQGALDAPRFVRPLPDRQSHALSRREQHARARGPLERDSRRLPSRRRLESPSPAVLSARLAHSSRKRVPASHAPAAMLTMMQWDQLIARIGAIPRRRSPPSPRQRRSSTPSARRAAVARACAWGRGRAPGDAS